MKTWKIAFALLFALVIPVQVCAQGTTAYNPVMRYQGTYNGSTIYNNMDVVVSSGATYVSLVGTNSGHTPASSPSQWAPITSAGGVVSFNTRTGAVVLLAADVQSATNTLSGCSTAGNSYNPATNTCVASANVTLSNVNPTIGRNALQAAQAPSLPSTNLLAYYTFLNGTGTTVSDISGAGHDATLCTGALGTSPAWIPNTGISPNTSIFTDCVQLPTALNAAASFDIALFINPIQSGTGNGTNPTAPAPAGECAFVTNSALPFYSSHGWVAGSSFGNQGTNICTPEIFNGQQLVQNNAVAGYHVLGVDLGTPNGSGGCTTFDALYVDGALLPGPFQSTSCSAGFVSSPDHWYIGPAPAGSGSGPNWQATQIILPGPVYSFAAYSTAQGNSGHALVSQVFHSENANRGAAVAPPVQNTQLPCQIAIGDSITYGFPSFTPYPSLLNLNNPPTTCLYSNAISGITIDASLTSEPYRSAPWCTTANGPAVATIFLGTNNFLFFNETPQQTFNKLMRHAGILKRAGCRVFVFTMLSRCQAGNCIAANGATYDANKDAFNTLISSGAIATGNVDGVIDPANFLGFGADNAWNTGEWVASFAFTTDKYVIDSNGNLQHVSVAGTSGGTQPTWCTTVSCTTTDGGVTWSLTTIAPPGRCVTAISTTPAVSGTAGCFRSEDETHPTQAGQYTIASIDSNYQNHIFGATKANPHVFASSTSAYAILPSDGAIVLTGTAAQPLTMPDCSGLSGLDFLITNTSSAAATVSLLTSTQPINGSTSTVTIAAGTSIDFIAQANPYAVSGCHWVHN